VPIIFKLSRKYFRVTIPGNLARIGREIQVCVFAFATVPARALSINVEEFSGISLFPFQFSANGFDRSSGVNVLPKFAARGFKSRRAISRDTLSHEGIEPGMKHGHRVYTYNGRND